MDQLVNAAQQQYSVCGFVDKTLCIVVTIVKVCWWYRICQNDKNYTLLYNACEFIGQGAVIKYHPFRSKPMIYYRKPPDSVVHPDWNMPQSDRF